MTGLAPLFMTKSEDRIAELTAARNWTELRDVAGTWAHLASLTLTREYANRGDAKIAVEVARDWAKLSIAADKATHFVIFPPQDAAAIQASTEASLAALEAELAR
jgi:hypothetical protein